MKNRDRYILKVDEHDMLLDMQYNIMNHGCVCALDALTGKMVICPDDMKGKIDAQAKLEVCSRCIQKFLNEES